MATAAASLFSTLAGLEPDIVLPLVAQRFQVLGAIAVMCGW